MSSPVIAEVTLVSCDGQSSNTSPITEGLQGQHQVVVRERVCIKSSPPGVPSSPPVHLCFSHWVGNASPVSYCCIGLAI